MTCYRFTTFCTIFSKCEQNELGLAHVVGSCSLQAGDIDDIIAKLSAQGAITVQLEFDAEPHKHILGHKAKSLIKMLGFREN